MDTRITRTRACRKPQPCIYYSTADGLCNYCLITGHARLLICGPGEACTVKETDHRGQRLSMTPEEERAAKKLYDQGFSDPVIAEQLNTSRTIIRGWRLRSGLGPNAKAGRPKISRPPASLEPPPQQKPTRRASCNNSAARQRSWYEKNREKWNAYLREYRRKKKEGKT